eukprot:CAMPEP_0174731816 /NCGR_PEP_ID=MMETSP1094-20130205/58222_1 /TAXON_ID=156173 /ORGANISM="Chrysochromulina brevifilum, Strain UTEX LB 985" /LENGTH=149 /DNA_ID=CAMNT_0015934237 /DNA_START=82 /DNA_END=531 /DNA_ORIENTATION=-
MKLAMIAIFITGPHVTALKRTVVVTPNAPAAIGPYSQAVLTTFASGERLVSAAGQIGLDPNTGKLVPGGIIYESQQAMNNVQAIVQAVPGFSMNDVNECTCFMANLTEYSDFNAVYAKYFDSEPPARAAVEVAKLPLGARVEVKCSAAA